MNGFQPQSQILQAAAPNPSKRVNYALGMVLGVDDFNQEFTYLIGRSKRIVRDLLGYGTVTGLKVSIETDSNGPRVQVAPGVAFSPSGQRICVTAAQCAYLNQWITKHKNELVTDFGSPPDSMLPLYVVLCYQECLTDMVPIPGEPCRTEQESMAPSRVVDTFSLELRLDPPDQPEEDALRMFVDWLSMIPIDDSFGSSTPLDEFVGAIRQASQLLGTSPQPVPESPPGNESFMFGSPPTLLHIQPDDLGEYLRTAFRIWITELRPLLRPGITDGGTPCTGSTTNVKSSDADCVLLAQVNVPLTGDWQVDDMNPVEIDEQHRPILLPLRLQQELITEGIAGASSSGVFIGSPPAFARHTVVAAGMIRGDNFASGSVFNGLTVTNTAKGELDLTFAGYVEPAPNGPFHYIVKAIPVANVNVKMPNVSFLEFRPTEFALSVANGNIPATQAQIENMEFMIEVSRFE